MSRFKKCGHCGTWLTRDDFVYGEELRPIGISFIDGDISMACYYFQHELPECGTCLALPVVEFASYIVEPILPDSLAQSEVCEHHCTSIEDLAECHQNCMYARYRRFLLTMLERKKKTTGATIPLGGFGPDASKD